MKLPDNVFNSISASFLPKQTTPYGEITTTTESQYIYSATHYEHGDYSDNISSQAPSSARTTHTESQRRQIDLLARLRIIEQLQSFSLPRFRSSIPDDLVTDILNWLTLCFCPNPTSDDVSVALAIYSGEIRMFVGNTPGSPSLSSLQHTKNIFKTALKQVLRGDRASDESPSANLVPPPGMSTPAASRLFLRMVVDIGWKRIQRKLNLLCHTSGEGPEQTGLRFVLLVQSWLFYRPDGERSKAFVNKAISRCGDVAGATDYMIQSFWIILNQAGKNLDEMGDEQRFRYLGSMMTACEMFVKSTFFEDLVSHHTFQITLKQADRRFLHTLLRRFSQIASYKTGAAKFAVIGIPFVQEVLGESGIRAFLENEPKGGIVFELISEQQEQESLHPNPNYHPYPESANYGRLTSPSSAGGYSSSRRPKQSPARAGPEAVTSSSSVQSYTWQESPLKVLPSILGISNHCGSSRTRADPTRAQNGSGVRVPLEGGHDDLDRDHHHNHSRETSTDTDGSCCTEESYESTTSVSTTSTTSSTDIEDDCRSRSRRSKKQNAKTYHELRRVDRQFQYELLSSDIISEAWAPGDIVTVKYHSVLQVIHYLDRDGGIEVLAQTVGTSKPICWMCREYIKCLEEWYLLNEDDDEEFEFDYHGDEQDPHDVLKNGSNSYEPNGRTEREERIPKRWFTSKGSGKVKDDWLIPPEAPLEVAKAAIEDAQKEMERIVEEVAFDSYSYF